MHSYRYDKMPEVKGIIWLFYDITMLGVGGYTLSGFFEKNINAIEQFILFLFSSLFFGYRISILHQDRRKKKIENDTAAIDLAKKKAALKARQVKK